MRPRYLEIEGLQSFKELQAVNFDRLGETGLFGIFGATGSGKSTILDAVTLALYGNVQRANRGTHGIINMSLPEMRVSFTFDLIKAEGRKTYRVERAYKRKKNSDNFTESKITRLIEVSALGEVVIADKQGDVNEAVINLIGLEFDDFTRSVVLPQNKFQEFLLAPKGEKTKMLERIFYLEEYGRELTEKVNRRLGCLRNKLSGIEGALSVLGDISDNSLKDSEEALAAAEGHKKKTDIELKTAEKDYSNAKDIWELSAELQGIESLLEELCGRSAEIETMRKDYKSAVAARGISERIGDVKATKLKLDKTEEELKILEVGLKELEGQLKNSEEALKESRDHREKRVPMLVEYRTKLEKALQTGEELAKIEETLRGLREEHQGLKKEVDCRNKSIEEYKLMLEEALKDTAERKAHAEVLKVEACYRDSIQKGAIIEEELDQLKNARNRQQSRIEDFSTVVAGQERELETLKESGLKLSNEMEALKASFEGHKGIRKWDRNDVARAETAYYEVRSAVDALRVKINDIEQLESKITDCNKQITILEGRLERLYREKGEKSGELENTQLIYEDKKREQERNSAFLLAQGLRDNEPCPVCGATVHPDPAASTSDRDFTEEAEAINKLQERIDSLEAEHRILENEIIKLTEQHNNLKSQEGSLAAERKIRQKEQAALYINLPEEYCGLPLPLLEKTLNKLQGEKQERLKAVEEWEKTLAELDASLKKSTEKYSRHQVESSGKQSQLDANRKHLEEMSNAFAESEETLSIKESSLYDSLRAAGVDSMRAELQRIQKNDRESESLYKDIQDRENSIAGLRKEIEKAEEARKLDAEKLTEIIAQGRGFKYQKEEKEKEIQSLVGDKDINVERLEIEKQMASLIEMEQNAQNYVNSVRENYEKAIKDKKVWEKQKEIFGEKLETDYRRLQRELADKGFATVEAAEEAIITEDRIKSMEIDIKEYEEALNSTKSQKSLIEKKLSGRSITEELWQEICGRHEALKLEKENSIAAYEGAKNRYESIKSNYENWLVLTKELQEHSRKKDDLETIKNLLRGNGFIEYISEERLRYIAKEASETLGTLTRHRYGLEIDSENGFVIRDDANGGMRRLITTLSGGETFLTSLALALALSSQIQLKGQSPLEFFFLDEGFGTLDNELLDTVMDALERLSTRERVIGLISHVPEMRSRITRRLVVEAPVINGTGSRVYMEKA